MSRKARENTAGLLLLAVLCQVVVFPIVLLLAVLLVAIGNATVTPRALGTIGLRLTVDLALLALTFYAAIRIMPSEERRERPGTWPELGEQP